MKDEFVPGLIRPAVLYSTRLKSMSLIKMTNRHGPRKCLQVPFFLDKFSSCFPKQYLTLSKVLFLLNEPILLVLIYNTCLGGCDSILGHLSMKI